MTESQSPSKEAVEVAKMFMEQQESDRGCVIFGAAMLEDELELLIRAYCRADLKSEPSSS